MMRGTRRTIVTAAASAAVVLGVGGVAAGYAADTTAHPDIAGDRPRTLRLGW